MQTKTRKNRRYTLVFVFILSICSLGLLNIAYSLPIAPIAEHYGAIRIDGGSNLSTWDQFKVLQPLYEPTTMLLLGLGLGMMGLVVAVWKLKS